MKAKEIVGIVESELFDIGLEEQIKGTGGGNSQHPLWQFGQNLQIRTQLRR